MLLVAGDRILLKNQTAGAENGIYVVQLTGAPVRATDNDDWSEMISAAVIVQAGTTQADTGWVCTANTGGTINVTTNNWFKAFSVAGAVDGTGAANLVAYWSDADTLTSNVNFVFDSSGRLIVGTTSAASSSMYTTRGTGTTNATFGYTHQNSSGQSVFKVADDGTTTIGNSTTAIITGTGMTMNSGSAYIINATAANLALTSTGLVQVQGGGTSSTTANLYVANTRSSTSSNQLSVLFSSAWTPVGAGTSTYVELDIAPTINQTTHTGASKSVYIHPTLTAVGSGGHEALTITATGQTALHTTAGKVRFDIGGDTAYDIFYRSLTGELARLGIGSNGQVLGITGGVPAWQTGGVAGNIYTTDGVIPATTTRTVGLGNSASKLVFQDLASDLMLEFGDGYIELGAGNITASAATAAMGASGGLFSVGATSLGITLQGATSTAVVTDNRTTKSGLQYAADYSATFSARSLVDKGYVDAALASAGSCSTAFIESSTATSVDLDANVGEVKDKNGTNVAFTIPTDVDKLFVFRNGALQGEGAGRDYTLNTGTNTITFIPALTATESVQLKKID